MSDQKTAVRPLNVIAAEISRLWERPYFGAVPFINAMRGLSAITDTYGYEDGESVVLYFLSNATTWRGDDARRIKAELKAALKGVGK